MALQLKFFVIPIREITEAEAEVNRFLSSVRVVSMQREFVAQGDNSFWSLAVEYLVDGIRSAALKGGTRKKSRIDYKEVLSPEAFAIFAKLREWRKKRAATEAVPVYTIFTNEQLGSIAEKGIATKAGLQQIDGIGEARIKRYGDEVIDLVTTLQKAGENEAGRRTLPTDSHASKPVSGLLEICPGQTGSKRGARFSQRF